MLKWVLPEPLSSEAAALRYTALLAPDLCFIECANALWRQVRHDGLTLEEAERLLVILRGLGVETVRSEALLPAALRLAVELGHPIYDCLYLSLALERGCDVMTADRRFHQAAGRTAYSRRVRLLGA